jgi:hypothetical protein
MKATSKQTAVEWLFLMLNNPNRNQDFANKLLEQAKAMEKKQIFEAWNTRAKINDVLTFTDNRTAEQYYTETYESQTNL